MPNRRRFAIVVTPLLALLAALLVGGSTASAQTPPCATGAAVPDAANNPGLVADCTALLAAKDVLEGANIASRDRLNWSTARAITSWTGVSLSGIPPRVTAIDLTERRLTGTIPPGLRDLGQLRSLNLQRNRLSGTIPPELSGLARLEELALSQNRLTGAIPARLGNLAALERLYAHSNRLTGAIPPELGNLAQLELLSLTANQLTGAIPAELADLSELRELYLYQNRLTGQIPPKLTQLDNLTALWLAFNRFTGCLPPALRDVRSTDFADLALEDCGPLALTLTAERAQCTAGTRTPVTWEITGSAPPYTLTVAGETVDADAESVTVTCAALPEPAEGEDPVTQAPGTIAASVTDETGVTATARAAYTIVPPLPAPETAGDIGAYAEALSFRWHTAEPPPGADDLVAFLVRWREAGGSAWTYEMQPIWRHQRRGITYGALAYFTGLRGRGGVRGGGRADAPPSGGGDAGGTALDAQPASDDPDSPSQRDGYRDPRHGDRALGPPALRVLLVRPCEQPRCRCLQRRASLRHRRGRLG